MAKKWICFILAVVLACSLCACGDQQDEQPQVTHDPTDYERVAEEFMTAHYLRDFATQFSFMFYDARQQQEDTFIKQQGSAEAFFAYAQNQVKENHGLDIAINSFDDYFAAYHEFYKNSSYDIFGEYTLTVTATASTKLEGDALQEHYNKLINNISDQYLDGDALRSIPEAYLVTVHIAVDGEKKDYSEHLPVYLVYYNSRWWVTTFSMA